MLNLHCSWTPEIDTIVHEGSHGIVFLQTSHDLKITPDHPHFLQESLIKKILAGMNQSPDEGMLQQIILSTPPMVPVFSPSQIDFLAPQLSMALSKATPEEIIHFRFPRTEQDSVQGTIAVFPPTYFLLVMKHAKEVSGISSKIYNSSRNLQITSSLTFAHDEAHIRKEKIQTFMEIPSTSNGILINYQPLMETESYNQENESSKPDRPIPGNEKSGSPIEIDSLREQLKNLQKRINEQSEEIRRLKQTIPP